MASECELVAWLPAVLECGSAVPLRTELPCWWPQTQAVETQNAE